jgi:hypothetical protein
MEYNELCSCCTSNKKDHELALKELEDRKNGDIIRLYQGYVYVLGVLGKQTEFSVSTIRKNPRDKFGACVYCKVHSSIQSGHAVGCILIEARDNLKKYVEDVQTGGVKW